MIQAQIKRCWFEFRRLTLRLIFIQLCLFMHSFELSGLFDKIMVETTNIHYRFKYSLILNSKPLTSAIGGAVRTSGNVVYCPYFILDLHVKSYRSVTPIYHKYT